MKRYITIFLILVIGLLTACGGETEPQEDSGTSESDSGIEGEATKEENTEEEQSIEVDKGLLNVEVTIPPSLLEDQNIDEVIAEAKEAGVSEVTENDDGSLTYKMSKSVHSEMMKEIENGLKENIDELKNSEDYVSIEDVISNNSFSEFTMVVNQEEYENSFDGFAALGLGISGLYYQLFDGVDPDDYKVTIHLENAETGEVFDTIVYPDALEEKD